jgi:hypothetical protein
VVQTSIDRAALTRERRVSVPRIVAAGCAAVVLVLLIGAAIELIRFGTSDAVAATRVEQDVRGAFSAMSADVKRLADAVASDPQVADAMASGLETDDGIRTVFDAAANARARLPDSLPQVAITIYDTRGVARGWAGRASDLPRERPTARPLFVATSPLGLRLVYLESIVATTPDRSRLGYVAVEHVLTPMRPGSLLLTAPEYIMPTPRANVQLRLHDPAAAPAPAGFVVAASDGTPLVDVTIPAGEIAGNRSRLRRAVAAAALVLIAITILLLGGPLLDARMRAREPRRELRLTAATLAVIAAGAGLLWVAFLISPAVDSDGYRAAAVLLGGVAAAALAATLVSGAVRLRVALRAIRRSPEHDWVSFVAAQLVCGIALAALLVVFERLLGRSLDPSQVDLRHFSLHP